MCAEASLATDPESEDLTPQLAAIGMDREPSAAGTPADTRVPLLTPPPASLALPLLLPALAASGGAAPPHTEPAYAPATPPHVAHPWIPIGTVASPPRALPPIGTPPYLLASNGGGARGGLWRGPGDPGASDVGIGLGMAPDIGGELTDGGAESPPGELEGDGDGDGGVDLGNGCGCGRGAAMWVTGAAVGGVAVLLSGM